MYVYMYVGYRGVSSEGYVGKVRLAYAYAGTIRYETPEE